VVNRPQVAVLSRQDTLRILQFPQTDKPYLISGPTIPVFLWGFPSRFYNPLYLEGNRPESILTLRSPLIGSNVPYILILKTRFLPLGRKSSSDSPRGKALLPSFSVTSFSFLASCFEQTGDWLFVHTPTLHGLPPQVLFVQGKASWV